MSPALELTLGIAGGAASVVAILEYFGIKPKQRTEGVRMTFSRAWKLVIMLVLVAASAGLSIYSFYQSRHPKIVEKIVEKPVEKIVERIVPLECPKVAKTAQRQSRKGGVAPITPTSIQQSNSGGVNVQQGTTGENSPIVNSPVTIGNVPKHISDQDAAAVAAYLLKAKAYLNAPSLKIRIAADQYSRPSPFVDEFYTAFKNGGWPMEDEGVREFMGFSAVAPKKFQGVEIITKGQPVEHEGEPITLHEPDPQYYIGKVLNALKIPVLLKRDPAQDEGVITIQFEGGISSN